MPNTEKEGSSGAARMSSPMSSPQQRPMSPPSSNVKISNIREKMGGASGMGGGGGKKFKNLMKKLAFESKGLKEKRKHFTQSASRSILGEMISDLPIDPKEQQRLELQLKAFATRHQSHHRPIALVTSGGTATDLEVRAVRYLDNFSTGQRGSVSVEEFLKRGYAVIHLWREGSAAPYSRVMSKMLGIKQANQGLGFEALGKLFEGQQDPDYEKDNNALSSQDGRHTNTNGGKGDDPWLTSTSKARTSSSEKKTPKKSSNLERDDEDDHLHASSSTNRMNLTSHILNSTQLQSKLRERANVVKEGLLLTVPFRTVEEYLAKLKWCTEAMYDCQSLGLIYLAAAVSDFYIPAPEKAQHKIQSRDYGISKNQDKASQNDSSEAVSAIRMDSQTNCLHLTLSPVPKVIPLIRERFAPNAFCVSFKLETDKDILVEKAKIAIQKYDLHMVIGNVLETRYDKVTILQNRDIYMSSDKEDSHRRVGGKIEIEEVKRSGTSLSSTSTDDELEDAMISHVVEKHFEYIANHYLSNTDKEDESNDVMPRTALMAGAEAAARHNAYLKEKKRQLQNELYWKRARDVTLNVAGHVLGMYITYAASSALQKRMR